MASQITVVSAERIAEELRKILVHPHRVRGMNLLFDLGLAAAVLPEIVPMKGLPQGRRFLPRIVADRGKDGGDLWDHVLARA